jgi:subtilisin family serine protease
VTAGKDGLLSSFSSIGPAPTWCTKPDFCAPGQALISSFNSHFIQKYNPAVDSYIVDLNGTHSDYTGRDYGWLALSGTSMACPVATGIIALWLQADPSLTKERIMEIIAKTSRQPDPALSYPNDHYGYGEIDAYRGMLEVLGMTGIRTISPTPLTTATVRPDGNGNIIIVPAASAATPNTVPADLSSGSTSASTGSTITVYDTAGHIVRRAAITSTTDTHTPIIIPAQDLHGIFVVQVGQQGSTIIRL